ncbi:hypothetical protein AB0D45_06905 [Streptomyces sp. NPDC048352]|uniref:hypothetical protein n=1 Tax=Streptomyces sp. NPDC048352 TaxID=3154718 RepID=UPI0034411108
MSARRQLELLDATARLGHGDGARVPARTISATLEISEKTITEAHGFLRQNGLVESGCQEFALTPAGLRLTELRALDSARARLHLRELWIASWFTVTALRLLKPGPQDAAAVAEGLIRGVGRRVERGLHLVQWLEYALVIQKDGHGRMAPVQEPTPTRQALPFLGTSEAIAALPREQFLAVMDAYRTIARSLTQAAESTPDHTESSPPR